MKRDFAIIGAGRAGRVFARRLVESGWRIGAVVTRSDPTARRAVRFIGAGSARSSISPGVLSARTILIATPDSVISSVGQELAKSGGSELRGRVVLHMSGSLSSSALDAVRTHGAFAGSIHVMQSFTGVGLPSMEGRIFAIEGDAPAVRIAREIARDLGGLPVQIAASAKAIYHCAAVMACAQVLSLMETSTRLLMSIGMKRRETQRALLPLTRQVLQDFERLGPTASWTGPLARKDFAVIEAHRQALLKCPPEFGVAYDALNQLSAGVLSPDRESMLTELDRIALGKSSNSMTTGV